MLTDDDRRVAKEMTKDFAILPGPSRMVASVLLRHMEHVEELEQSMIFEINDGMGSRVDIDDREQLQRLVEVIYPFSTAGASIIGCAVQRIEKGIADERCMHRLDALCKNATHHLPQWFTDQLEEVYAETVSLRRSFDG